jgi:hypothetical protein
MNAKQLRELIVRPTLRYLDPEIPYSETAVELLMMTAAHESNLGEYIAQINGPALGIYQMEPDTEIDIHYNFLKYRRDLENALHHLTVPALIKDEDGVDLIYSLPYATAMARVHYYRDPQALPSGSLSNESTIRELAHYAKRVFNTELGKAHADDYYNAYMRRCCGSRV